MTDEQLMKLFIEKHDSKSLEEIYRRYADKLLGYFFKMFDGDVAKAQDFLQDLFVKVIEKKSQFDTSKRFYSWVFTIACNMCMTDFRPKLLKPVSDSDKAFSKMTVYEEAMDRRQSHRLLRKAIHSLDQHHKVVFILRHQEGFSLKEIAEITETSLGTVKSRLFYATKNIAETLKKELPNQWEQLFKIS